MGIDNTSVKDSILQNPHDEQTEKVLDEESREAPKERPPYPTW